MASQQLDTLKNLLSTTTLGAVLADRTTVFVEPTATIHETVQLLVNKSILSVPVVLSKGGTIDCLGFVSVFDVMLFLLESIEKYLAGHQQDLEALTTSLRMSDVSSILDQRDSWVSYTPSDNLLKPLERFSSDVHRAPVWNDPKTAMVGILSQSDYISFLNAYKTDDSLSFAMSSKITELEYTNEIYIASWSETVFSCLKMMREKRLTAIPLVNEKQELVGCLSATDVKTLAATDWARVFDDVKDYLADFFPASLIPVTVTETSTFSDVLLKMTAHRVHRLFVVDGNKHPIGVVTMTDVIRWLYLLLGK